MTLHLVNKASDLSPALRDCIHVLKRGNAVLLLEDAVRNAAGMTADAGDLLQDIREKGCICHVLQQDLAERGLESSLLPDCKLLDYAAFVQLCLEHDKVLSWA